MSYSAYFLNFAQFCLRIVPFTLLLFLPHGSNGWKGRVSHPLRTVIGLGAFDIAASALSPLFTAKLAQNLYHLCAFAALTLFYMLLIRDSPTKKTVGLFLALAFWGAQTQLLLTMNLARYLAEGGAVDAITLDNDAIGSLGNLGLLVLADALLLPLAAAFEVRIARPYLQYVKPENMRIEMLLLQFLGIFLSFFSFFFVGVISSVGGGLQYVALETLIFIAIHCALCWLVFRTSLSVAKNAENALQSLFRQRSRFDEVTTSTDPKIEVKVLGSGGSLSGRKTRKTTHYTIDDLDTLLLAACEKSQHGVFVTVDEVQKVPLDDMSRICGAVQMASRKGREVMLAVAGLPGAHRSIIVRPPAMGVFAFQENLREEKLLLLAVHQLHGAVVAVFVGNGHAAARNRGRYDVLVVNRRLDTFCLDEALELELVVSGLRPGAVAHFSTAQIHLICSVGEEGQRLMKTELPQICHELRIDLLNSTLALLHGINPPRSYDYAVEIVT